MNPLHAVAEGATHQLFHHASRVAARGRPDPAAADRDRGAVSLEQVLWYVAAGVAVAVIAGILWGQIRDQANTDVVTPTAP